MELPNIYFQDFPIDFKQINPDDFPHFVVEDKITISPNDDGFISDTLKDHLRLDENNTVVINAAVGQGKTTAIIDIVKEYYDKTDYIIFIASPFVSLVEQYYKKSIAIGIPESDVYRYELIGKDFHRDAWNSRVQVVTVNCLLGNPGEDSLTSSDAKRNYINSLSQKCKDEGRKAVFIYDEIHDAIHNFDESFIFNLYKWKDVIHKNFLLSATYNEASKIVIEYLAELTDRKIQIIESERKTFPEKQSELFLHFNSSSSYSQDNDGIVQVIEGLVREGKNVDVLSYSKILADNICKNTDTGIGRILTEAYGDVHNCTSDLDNNARVYSDIPENRYNPDMCNVGTNFKTGVSIEKENHAFVIIMPPSSRKGTFKNKYGIFSDGVNSIVQALARQRTKGEIHIILPPPDKFNFESLPFSETQKEKFIEYYTICQNFKHTDDKLVQYHSFNNQDTLLKEYYENKIKGNICDEEEYIKTLSRENLPSLQFPDYKKYKLTVGERYFTKYHKFFGGDLSSFILYAAITNQFINCRLAGINMKPVLFFEEGKIQWKLAKTLNNYLDFEYYNMLRSVVSDSYFYSMIKNDVFSQFKVLYRAEDSRYIEIKPNQHKNFEQQLLAFVQKIKHPEDRQFASRFIKDKSIIDVNFPRGEYFGNCISIVDELSENSETIPESQKDLIDAYSSLKYFRQKMIANISTTGRDTNYLPHEVFRNFVEEKDLEMFNSMIKTLSNTDPVLNKEIFDFKNSFTRGEYTEEMKIQAFYNYLKTDFFKGKSKRINNSELNANVFEVNQIEELPNSKYLLNLITREDLVVDESNLPVLFVDNGVTFIKQSDGSLESLDIS